MLRYFIFSENTKIYVVLSTQKTKQKALVKCCIEYFKDIYLLLEIKKADTILIKFLAVRDVIF